MNMILYIEHLIAENADHFIAAHKINQYITEVAEIDAPMEYILKQILPQLKSELIQKWYLEYQERIAEKCKQDLLKQKEEQQKQQRIQELENEMDELRKDFAQDAAGIFVENLEQKRVLYRQYYKELCELKNLTPKPEKINL